MFGIKEKIQQIKKNGDVITCNNIKIYASKQKDKQFDGALFCLIKAFENMKIEFQLIILDARDAFGQQLPLLRVENKILQRSSFLDIIRVLYLHSDDDNQGEEKNSRASNFIDLCQKFDQISTYFQFYDEETEYPYRDAYSWFIQPIKKLAYRWRMRTFSHFYEQKGLLNKSNVLNDAILILNKLVEIFEFNGSKSFSQGVFGGKHPHSLDICDILVTGVLVQMQFNLSLKCDLVKLIDQGKFIKLKEFCSEFFKNNKPQYFNSFENSSSEQNISNHLFSQTGTFTSSYFNQEQSANLCLFYDNVIHPEVQQARDQANEKAPTEKKLRKMMINNISVNSLALFLMVVVLMKYKPKEAEQLAIQE